MSIETYKHPTLLDDTYRLIFNTMRDTKSTLLHNSQYVHYIESMSLSVEDYTLWCNNPHWRASVINKTDYISKNRSISHKDRIINFEEDTSGYVYKESPKSYISLSHSGQRKLLISEIEFLTKYGDLCKEVIYIGAAAGYHIPLLSSLFPSNKFILYDPNPFAIEETKKIKIHNKLFLDKDAREYENRDVLFISDIRSRTEDEDVMRDNKLQKRIISVINPIAASLKFRMPFKMGRDYTYKYLEGEYYYQPWAGNKSSESRLFWERGNGGNFYINLGKYEDLMYKHNTYWRHSLFKNKLLNEQYMDRCYDCSSESYILSKYVDKYYKEDKKEAKIIELSKIITRDTCRPQFT